MSQALLLFTASSKRWSSRNLLGEQCITAIVKMISKSKMTSKTSNLGANGKNPIFYTIFLMKLLKFWASYIMTVRSCSNSGSMCLSGSKKKWWKMSILKTGTTFIMRPKGKWRIQYWILTPATCKISPPTRSKYLWEFGKFWSLVFPSFASITATSTSVQ